MYATWCTAVEGNTTFYAVPSPPTVAAWAEQMPERFRMMCKLPRTVTHERRLRDAGDEVRQFLAAIEPLGDRADVVSVQLPPSFGPADLDELDRFLASAPSAHRWAVEVRHPAFFATGPDRRRLADVLSRRGAEWIAMDTTVLFAAPPGSEAERDGWEKKPRLPRRALPLTDRPIVRYVGRDDVAATVAGWAPWVDRVVRWLGEGRSPTVFVHTPDNVEAPQLARRFHQEVRARVVALAPLPEPLTDARLF